MSSKPLFTNNAATALAVAITPTDTILQVTAGTGQYFPQPTGSDYFMLTLIQINNPEVAEIVKCTARSGDILTVVRGQEGTQPQIFNISDNVQLRITAGSLNLFALDGDASNIAFTPYGFVTATNVQGAIQQDTDHITTNTNAIAAFSTSSGSSLVGYNEGGTGAVTRTVQARLRDYVSVKDFGAVGDGLTDDSAAIQAAMNAASALYFPPGVYYVGYTLNLPYKNFVMFGEGSLSRIFGTVNPLIAYPSTTGTVTQNIYNMTFDATDQNICVNMVQTWDGNGKVGPVIDGCTFYTSLADANNAICLNLTGVWAATITNNTFFGNVVGSPASARGGGYGITMELGSNMNTSVMNVLIANNKFVEVCDAIYISPRISGGDGRVEGISILDNSFIQGLTAITCNQTLATIISGNIISDFNVAIQMNGDFEFAINDNVQVDGLNVGIQLVATASSFMENGTISGNQITVQPNGVGVQLNTYNNIIRSLTISGNSIGNTVSGTPTGTGIQIQGNNPVSLINVNGNAFQQLANSMTYGTQTGQSVFSNGNTYSYVTNAGPQQSTPYNLSTNITLVGGNLFETINISIPGVVFTETPINGFLTSDGVNNVPFIGLYKKSTSSYNNATFVILSLSGTNLQNGSALVNLQLNGF
jgi:hypothetical protein